VTGAMLDSAAPYHLLLTSVAQEVQGIKATIIVFALALAVVPAVPAHAAYRGAGVAIRVSVIPAASVPNGTSVTVVASTTRRVSDVWIFIGSIDDIVNVAYVASCDAPPNGGVTRCAGHARYRAGFVELPDPPYHQSKRGGNVQTFFACWNTIAVTNCSTPVKVTWTRRTHGSARSVSQARRMGDQSRRRT
jgi:hypothetical protein